MTVSALRACGRAAVIIAAAVLAAGCATRYDSQGNQIYVWQYGQGSNRDIDYSNPRMPILPPQRPSTDLWPVPSPYEFNDLSRWSSLDGAFVAPIAGQRIATAESAGVVGDNRPCAACNDTTMRLALAAPRAVDRERNHGRVGR